MTSIKFLRAFNPKIKDKPIFDSVKLYPTKTGENTLYLPEMDETYHSREGVLTEAMHVFIEQGFNRMLHLPTINIFEVGFGTGLNALVTAAEVKKTDKKVFYTSIEAYPVPVALAQELNYGTFINQEPLFAKLHAVAWGKMENISDNFQLHKVENSLLKMALPNETFDVIYFDAFAPKKQPEMWEKAIFEKLYNSLKKGGVLTTYSAAGQLKRDLKSVGFTIENPPGANGKREMTVAVK
jgi:tRNA U34 5-methylaminomethyl-2-thiouridine-forming methyltransferase MnmC